MKLTFAGGGTVEVKPLEAEVFPEENMAGGYGLSIRFEVVSVVTPCEFITTPIVGKVVAIGLPLIDIGSRDGLCTISE